MEIPFFKTIVLTIGFAIGATIWGTFGTVDAGNVGIKKRLGNVTGLIEPGFYIKLPIIDDVLEFNTQTQKEQTNAQAASSDLQTVTTTIAVNYNINSGKVIELYTRIGRDYTSKVIDPAIQEAVKAATAKFSAEQLITKRQDVRDHIKAQLVERLSADFINVTDVAIVNFDFSQSFNQAIEAKVTAEQNALAAKNKLEQVKFEAQQKVETARAEAEAIKIQAQAINSQGGADYVALKKTEKWDGKACTQYCGIEAMTNLVNTK